MDPTFSFYFQVTSDPNFNAKFVLKSMFLMLGPYGPPFTTNGLTEDLDHLSVNKFHAILINTPGFISVKIYLMHSPYVFIC